MKLTKREWAILLSLAAAQFCNIVDFMIMMPLGSQMMRIFQISPQQFSLLVAAYSFSSGISGFLIAFVADRFDRKRLLTWIFTGFTLGTLACALAPNYHFLLLARLGTGVFGGVISSIVLAIVSDLVPMQKRGTAMGVITTAFSAASVFGVPFGLFLASTFNWHAPFLFVVLVSMPILFLMIRIVPKVDSHLQHAPVSPWRVLKNIWDNANQVRALLFICALMFGHFVVIPFLAPSMVLNVGFTEDQLAWIYFIGGSVSIVTGPWVGRLADRIGKQKVFTGGVILAFVPVLWITHMGPSSLFVALLATTLFFACSGGRMIPAFAIASGTVTPRNRGSFMSLQSCLQSLALSAASYIGGLIVVEDGGSGRLLHYPWIGYIAVFMGLVCLWLVRRIKVIDNQVPVLAGVEG
jgi:predicted MFS family arabinose efflux permease